MTQKVSFLYLLGKHYWGHSQHILSIFKSYTFESDTFESDTFESDTFFDIFAKCMESVWDDPNSDFLEDLKNFKSDTLKVTLFVSLLEVHYQISRVTRDMIIETNISEIKITNKVNNRPHDQSLNKQIFMI